MKIKNKQWNKLYQINDITEIKVTKIICKKLKNLLTQPGRLKLKLLNHSRNNTFSNALIIN